MTIAEAGGYTIDKTPPPWSCSSLGFAPGEQQDYRNAFDAFDQRVSKLARADEDAALAAALEPGGRWNGLIGGVVSPSSAAPSPRRFRRATTTITTTAK